MSTDRLKGWSGNEKINYLNACIEFVNDENAYAGFKRNPNYTPILEHVDRGLATQYYNLLRDEYKNKIAIASSLNDIIGNPILFSFPEGNVSGTTLRYLKVLQDIDDKNNIKGDIIEIGAGYGGQARLILALAKNKKNIESYTAIDLFEPSRLQSKYNKDILNFEAVDFDTFCNSNIKNVNFVISNYAFSELPRNIQDIYIEKVLKKSKHSYITYNAGAGWEYTYDELFSILSDKKIIMESENIEFSENKILTW